MPATKETNKGKGNLFFLKNWTSFLKDAVFQKRFIYVSILRIFVSLIGVNFFVQFDHLICFTYSFLI